MVGSVELHRRMGFHPAGPATAPIFELNRSLALLVGAVWDQALPQGRELSLALTALEEALMRANQALACNADPHDYTLPELDVATELDDVLTRLEGPEITRSGAAGTVRALLTTILTAEQVQGLTPRTLADPAPGLVEVPPTYGDGATR